MTLKPHEQSLVRAMYLREGSLRRTAQELGYSPSTVKKYVQGCYSVDEQNTVRELRTDDERLIGTYVGLWMGDGTQYYDRGYVVKICLDKRNSSLIEFVGWVLDSVFGCSYFGSSNPGTNSYYIKLYSNFVYTFVNEYCIFSDYKTSSVQLNRPISSFSDDFLAGCLLGLMLSDGHLDLHARFNVTSSGLAQNMIDILKRFGFEPSKYVQVRDTPNWNDLIQVTLDKKQSSHLEEILNCTLNDIGCPSTFRELKYEMTPP